MVTSCVVPSMVSAVFESPLDERIRSLVEKIRKLSEPSLSNAPTLVILSPEPDCAILSVSATVMLLPDPFAAMAPEAVSPVVVVVPFTCNAVVGSEVPIPTRLLVTSRYSRFVSNARSTPFLVRLDFSTDPDIRPMAILWYSFYNNVSRAYAPHGLVIIADRQQYGYLCA